MPGYSRHGEHSNKTKIPELYSLHSSVYIQIYNLLLFAEMASYIMVLHLPFLFFSFSVLVIFPHVYLLYCFYLIIDISLHS